MTGRRKLAIGIVAAVVVVGALVAGGLYWFFRDDAPPEASLEAAREGLADKESTDDQPTGGSSASSTAGDTSTPPGDVTGTWVVDTETGEFDFEDATGTFVGFRVQEELSGIGSATAVGRTNTITGIVEIDGTTLRSATFEVDLTEITTNDQRRNARVQEALETDEFPMATFVLTEPVDLGGAATSGEPVSVTARGELTVHGVTRPAEFELEAQLVDGTIVVAGSTEVVFSDFDVTVPSSPVVLSVEDHGVLELQLLLVRE